TVVSSNPRLSVASMSTLITTLVPYRALNSSSSSFMMLANFREAPTGSSSADAQKCVGIAAVGPGGGGTGSGLGLGSGSGLCSGSGGRTDGGGRVASSYAAALPGSMSSATSMKGEVASP